MTKAAKGLCTAAGGTCTVERDGYYVMSAICLGAGFLLLVFFMIPTARRLQCAFLSLAFPLLPTSFPLLPSRSCADLLFTFAFAAIPPKEWRVRSS